MMANPTRLNIVLAVISLMVTVLLISILLGMMFPMAAMARACMAIAATQLSENLMPMVMTPLMFVWAILSVVIIIAGKLPCKMLAPIMAVWVILEQLGREVFVRLIGTCLRETMMVGISTIWMLPMVVIVLIAMTVILIVVSGLHLAAVGSILARSCQKRMVSFTLLVIIVLQVGGQALPMKLVAWVTTLMPLILV
jgi:hypothetical protein